MQKIELIYMYFFRLYDMFFCRTSMPRNVFDKLFNFIEFDKSVEYENEYETDYN